jgi:hypothetical protein
MLMTANKRYVQFLAELYSDPLQARSPMLRDVTIRWPGKDAVIDIGGAFTKSPAGGQYELSVDGHPLVTALKIELEIFKETLGYEGKKMARSALTSEVAPLNTTR